MERLRLVHGSTALTLPPAPLAGPPVVHPTSAPLAPLPVAPHSRAPACTLGSSQDYLPASAIKVLKTQLKPLAETELPPPPLTSRPSGSGLQWRSDR